jgi:AraC family transcriptional regulator, alkane utilization regulator
VDALSDVLAAIRLDGAVYIKAEFKAPWCVETQYGLHTAATRLPRADHIVFFHLLTDGSCKARLVDGNEEVEVAAGDLLLFPHDNRHLLGSDLMLSPAPVGSEAIEGLIEMRWGGDGEATRFICGYLACDRRACRALLGPLPAMLRIPLGDISKSGWLGDLLHIGVQESLATRRVPAHASSPSRRDSTCGRGPVLRARAPGRPRPHRGQKTLRCERRSTWAPGCEPDDFSRRDAF